MTKHLIAEEGPLTGQILELEGKKQWVIGRDPDQADLVLADATVSRKHVLLKKTKEGIVVKDLSSTNPILVNDTTPEKNQLLTEGDQIKIGDNLFIYSEEEIPVLDQEPAKKDKTEKKEDLFDTLFEEMPEDIASKEEKKEDSPSFQEPEEEPEELKKEEEKKQSEETPYDTIFEESPSEELPFDMMQDFEFLLKVLSGPNSGAEFGMDKDKTYIIGKDPNTCDIVFNDLSVSKEHARVMIDNDGNVSIEDLHSRNKTRVNGVEIAESTPLSLQDIVSLGTTSFLVINKTMEMQTIYSPLPAYQLPQKEEEKELAAASKKSGAWRDQIIPTKHLAIGASFILVFFVVFLSFFGLFKSESLSTKVKDETRAITKIVNNYKTIDFSYNPGGETLFLIGHVLTETDHKELLYSLNQLPNIKNITDNVIIDELVWKNFNGILNDNPNWRGIHVYSPEAGKFILQGYIKTPKDGEELTDYVNVNFPYTSHLDNQVVIEDILQTEIVNIFVSAGFQALSFELNNGDITVVGRYDENRQRPYKNALNDIRKLKGIRSINNLALATTEQTSRINLTKKYAITGFIKHDNKNMSVVANGLIVSSGDIIDGMKITEILSDEILLEKEGIKYKINYSP